MNKLQRTSIVEQLAETGCSAEIVNERYIAVDHPRREWLERVLTSLEVPFSRSEQGGALVCNCETGGAKALLHAVSTAFQPQAMLFDMDGVLADDSGSFRAAIIETARSFGAVVANEDIAVLKAEGNANNDWVVTQRLLEQNSIAVDLDTVTERFQELYLGTEQTEGLRMTETLIPPRDFLAALSSRYPMAVVTGRPREDCDWFLAHAGIAEFFTLSVCMEDCDLKPSPQPVLKALELLGVETSWMFGDTPDDIVAARKAGAAAVGVTAPCDTFDAANAILTAAGAAAVVNTVNEIEELLP